MGLCRVPHGFDAYGVGLTVFGRDNFQRQPCPYGESAYARPNGSSGRFSRDRLPGAERLSLA
jgi:hypothetical protein